MAESKFELELKLQCRYCLMSRFIFTSRKVRLKTIKWYRLKSACEMTAGRAVLIELMQRYLSGLLDPSISLLEVHKLLYFMQRSR